MRASYHEELNDLLDNLQHITVLVEMAVSKTATSLLEPDPAHAEAVISNDSQLDAMHEELEYRCLSLLALQAPMVGELRTIVSAIRMVLELARIGDLAAHVVKIARLRFPNSAVSDLLRENFPRISEVCVAMTQLANQSLKDHDTVAALRMAEIDYKMDHLHRNHFGVSLGKNWSGSVEQAIGVTLLGCYFERFTDHTIAVACHVVYTVTDQLPEGEEWSNA